MNKLISKLTKLQVADNTGVKRVQSIHIYRGKACGAGDIIRVCVKEVMPNVREKYFKNTFNAMVVRTKGNNSDGNGCYTRFSDNAVVILDEKREPIGTRVLGPISRKVKNSKILSMAQVVY